MLQRRNFLVGAVTSLIAAPAIVRAASIMPVKSLPVFASQNEMDSFLHKMHFTVHYDYDSSNSLYVVDYNSETGKCVVREHRPAHKKRRDRNRLKSKLYNDFRGNSVTT